LGAEIRDRREAARLQQRDLADLIGYDRSYLSHVERGRQIPAEPLVADCDRVLRAGGALLRLFGELQAERQARHRAAAMRDWQDRAKRRARADPGGPVPLAAGGELAGEVHAPSDTDMERRPFMRMLGTFTGAAAVDALGLELWDLASAMQGSKVSSPTLDHMEASVLRLHQVYAKLPPAALLPHVQQQLHAVTQLLNASQPIHYRRRLCVLAGHLAGLRAWLTFDLRDPSGSRVWYQAALEPALEAEDDALTGWLLGAASLIPSYDGNHRGALKLIERGRAHAERTSNVAVSAWLASLEARAHAGMADLRAFRKAQDRSNHALGRTSPEERRHGMDYVRGHLDVTYYQGTSLVTLRQPEAARPALEDALAAQGAGHVKAQSIVRLAIAGTHVQEREIEQACAVALQALDLPDEQRIGPINQRARDLVAELEPWRGTPAVRELRERLATASATGD
jgi:transcriptional regulator with XRE-family HTH domain